MTPSSRTRVTTSRSRASQILTRQPVEGRSREGGLRFGEMERDCIIAHGAASVLSERLFYSSDPYTVPLCRTCGLLAQPAASNMRVRNTTACCRACGSTDVVNKDMPFANKLLLQELMTAGIAPRVRLHPPAEDQPLTIGEDLLHAK